MRRSRVSSFCVRPLKLIAIAFACVALAGTLKIASAAAWNNLEPFKSRRADVEQVLGAPLKNQSDEASALQFKVAGGTVTVAFVDRKFIETKKLAPELEGTIKEIILQHDRSPDTPESLDLAHKSDFKREDMRGGGAGNAVYRNLKIGIVYTFIGGRLRTTYYTPSADQLSRAQKKSSGKND